MKKIIFIQLILLSALVVVQSCTSKKPVTFLQPVQPPYAIQIIADHGLTSIAPENTKPAVQAAIDIGIPWVKLDIRMTKDGNLVVLNETELQNAGSSTLDPQMLNLADVAKLDVGNWFASKYKGTHIATLHEMLDFCKNKINLIADCQHVEATKVVEVIKAANMENQVMVTGDQQFLRDVHGVSSGQVATLSDYIAAMSPDGSRKASIYSISAHNGDIDTTNLKNIRGEQAPVLLNLVGVDDRPALWRKGIHIKADYILTDNPAGLLAEYQRALIPSEITNKVSAHRGANQFAPENTLADYEKAIEMQVDFIEIDVRLTKDHHLVILHDGNLDRTTNGHGPMREALFDSVRNLSAGAWFGSPYKNEKVPTLTEVCQLLSDRNAENEHKVNLYMDCKDPDVPEMVHTLERFGLLEGAVFYGSEETLRKIRDVNPKARLMPPLEDPDKIVRTDRPDPSLCFRYPMV